MIAKGDDMSARAKLLSAGLCTALAVSAAPRAEAYAIDCAILLCLAGGFPASAECSAAKVEVIRRVTPWPIEPPLQLWNCPMGGGSVSLPGGGSDAIDPNIQRYRSAIEVWQITRQSYNSSGGREINLSATRYFYSDDGEFQRSGVSDSAIPAWVSAAVQDHTGVMLTSNRMGQVRGILLKTADYRGVEDTTWVSY